MLAFQTSSVELTAGRSNQKGCVKMRKVCIQKMSEDVISLYRGCADNCLHALGEVQHDSYKFTGVVFLILVSPRLDQMLGGATQEPDFSYHKKPGLSPTDRQRTPFATWQSELSTICMIRSTAMPAALPRFLPAVPGGCYTVEAGMKIIFFFCIVCDVSHSIIARASVPQAKVFVRQGTWAP